MHLQGLFLSPARLLLLLVFLLLYFQVFPKALFHLAVQRSSCYHLPCHLLIPLSFFLYPLFPVLPCLYPFCNPQDLLLPLLSVLLHRYLYFYECLLLFHWLCLNQYLLDFLLMFLFLHSQLQYFLLFPLCRAFPD